MKRPLFMGVAAGALNLGLILVVEGVRDAFHITGWITSASTPLITIGIIAAFARMSWGRSIRWWLWPWEKRRSHLGWKFWFWYESFRIAPRMIIRPDGSQHYGMWAEKFEGLYSPFQGTPWPDEELEANYFDDEDLGARGHAGIHARLLPRNWMHKRHPDRGEAITSAGRPAGNKVKIITGVVERYDRYVLGVRRWRAERVIIRELMCRTEEMAEKLRKKYPLAKVHVVRRRGWHERLFPWLKKTS